MSIQLSSRRGATRVISAVVPEAYARRLEELARAGDRSFSREIARAVREHVDRATPTTEEPQR